MTGSLFLSLNHEGGEPPDTIDLVPPGPALKGRDGRGWTLPDAERVAAASMRRLPKLPIDINHATDLAAPSGRESPAAGWITGLRAMPNGAIRAEVSWNRRGRKAMRNREYSFISPVLNVNGRGEVTEILRAGLTNSPNLDLPALNSENLLIENNADKDTEAKMKKELCAALGLPEAATDAEVVMAAQSARTAALNAALPGADSTKPDLSAYAPRAELNAMQTRAEAAERQIAELNAARLKADAEAVVDGAVKDGRIAPANREEYLALCADGAGLERVKKIVANSARIVTEGEQAPEGSPPPSGAALNAEQSEIAKAMGYSAAEAREVFGGSKNGEKEKK